ncbi:unnamed protein product [Anisakis simplex]|uniref:Uncharacterized protein n=1 Tax=Anisakis simplex TaxID=6269 RepID=A0A158PMT5_ANISI|nr:unnamed protein product [Anisakis simplex]
MEHENALTGGHIISSQTTQPASVGVTQRFLFTATDVHFWTVGPSKVARNETNPVNTSNSGDQLRYYKQEQNTRRRYRCSLYACVYMNAHYETASITYAEVLAIVLLEDRCTVRPMSQHKHQEKQNADQYVEKNELTKDIGDREGFKRSERRKYIDETTSLDTSVKRNDADSNATKSNGDVKNANERDEWDNWMKSKPISVLKLDRTERLVLRIGGRFFLKFFFLEIN